MKNEKVDNFIKNSNIKSIYYFHADHFEPTSLDNKEIISDKIVGQFIKDMNAYNHSKRMSLFYRPTFSILCNDKRTGPGFHRVENDFVSFHRSKNTEASLNILSRLKKETDHEFQLHAHHEHFTFSDDMPKETKRAYINNDNNYKSDRDRLSLYIKLCKEFIMYPSKNTAPSPNEWFFVHGKWALNGSDMRVCRMEDEIQILKSHGCSGDFTFPAGRHHCDPNIKSPFTIKPIRCLRSYDYSVSQASAVSYNSNVITKDRFFIWNSDLKHPLSSFDYFSPQVLTSLACCGEYLYNLLRNSVRINDMLFIKTYSHSLAPEIIKKQKITFPLGHYNILKIFELLESSCVNNNIDLNYVTASEVYKMFKNIDNGSI